MSDVLYDKDISILARLIKDTLVELAPNKRRKSTNALRNSIHIEGNNIIVGGGIVDYAVYTNEKWISPRWNGKQNPNEAWVEVAVRQVILVFATRYGYTVKGV